MPEMDNGDGRVLGIQYEPSEPLRVRGVIEAVTPHGTSGNRVDSLGVTLKHTWYRQRSLGNIQLPSGRVIPRQDPVECHTYYYTILVGESVGTLLPYLGEDLKGRDALMCGNPYSGGEEPGEGGARKVIIHVRDARVLIL